MDRVCIGQRNTYEILINRMIRLEYRGYDDTIVNDGEMNVPFYVSHSNRHNIIDVRILLILVFILCMVTSSNAQKVTPYFICSKTIDKPYGVTTHISRNVKVCDYRFRNQELQMMKRTGITCCRADLDYIAVHANASGWNPVLTDSMFLSLKQNKVDFLGIINANAAKHAWEDEKGYQKYLDYIVQRYSNNTKYWEAVNEMELMKGVENLPEKYFRMLKMIYNTVKKQSKYNVVLSTSICNSKGDFFEELCKKNAYKYFDIMNFHSYDAPENLPKSFENIKYMMDKYGWSKPVWLTECGMHTADDKIKHNGSSLVEEQARRVARIYLISFAYGVDKVFWYNLRASETDPYYSEANFGLIHADLSPKPSFLAYKALTTMCPSRSTRPVLIIDGGTYSASWIRPDGKTVWAIWYPSGKKTVSLNVTGICTFYNYLGEKIKLIKKGMLDLDGGVTYIVGKNIVITKI